MDLLIFEKVPEIAIQMTNFLHLSYGNSTHSFQYCEIYHTCVAFGINHLWGSP
jgi:hypothetical protein